MELETLNEIGIDRCYFILSASPLTAQLHELCNALIEAYAPVGCTCKLHILTTLQYQ